MASAANSWRDWLFTWGVLVLFPVPIALYFGVTSWLLNSPESFRFEFVAGYIAVVFWFLWDWVADSVKERWRGRGQGRGPATSH